MAKEFVFLSILRRFKYACLMLAFLLIMQHVKAQNRQIYTGVGNLEYLHAGIQLPILKSRFAWQSSLGINPIGKNHISTFNNRLLIPFISAEKQNRPKALYFGASTFLWQFNNPYNRFLNLSVGPEIVGQMLFKNKQFGIQIGGGFVYNNVLIYKRKTYDEVGWPHEWMPSFSVQIFRTIK